MAAQTALARRLPPSAGYDDSSMPRCDSSRPVSTADCPSAGWHSRPPTHPPTRMCPLGVVQHALLLQQRLGLCNCLLPILLLLTLQKGPGHDGLFQPENDSAARCQRVKRMAAELAKFGAWLQSFGEVLGAWLQNWRVRHLVSKGKGIVHHFAARSNLKHQRMYGFAQCCDGCLHDPIFVPLPFKGTPCALSDGRLVHKAAYLRLLQRIMHLPLVLLLGCKLVCNGEQRRGSKREQVRAHQAGTRDPAASAACHCPTALSARRRCHRAPPTVRAGPRHPDTEAQRWPAHRGGRCPPLCSEAPFAGLLNRVRARSAMRDACRTRQGPGQPAPKPQPKLHDSPHGLLLGLLDVSVVGLAMTRMSMSACKFVVISTPLPASPPARLTWLPAGRPCSLQINSPLSNAKPAHTVCITCHPQPAAQRATGHITTRRYQ